MRTFYIHIFICIWLGIHLIYSHISAYIHKVCTLNMYCCLADVFVTHKCALAKACWIYVLIQNNICWIYAENTHTCVETPVVCTYTFAFIICVPRHVHLPTYHYIYIYESTRHGRRGAQPRTLAPRTHVVRCTPASSS